MTRDPYTQLGRRERQLMDALYRLGRASVSEVLHELPDPPSYSAVRAMLRKLEEKGHVGHEPSGPRYIYFPLHNREQVTRSALRRLIRTFFRGSASSAVAAMLDDSAERLTQEELDELAELIEEARRRGR